MSGFKGTPGPWEISHDLVYSIGCNDVGDVVCQSPDRKEMPESAKKWTENARRIVACVNACDSDGLPTSALEVLVAKGGRLKGADWYVDMLDRQLEQTEQQRDALLAALERMLGKAYKQNWNDQYPAELEQAESAIAKAIGETK